VDSLGIRLVGNEWVKEWILLRTTWRKRGPLVMWTNTSGETSVGTLQARETIKQPCSDVLVYTLEVGKGARLYNGTTMDNPLEATLELTSHSLTSSSSHRR
jgi:hypothetical protein